MDLLDLFIIAAGLAMDCFAVAVCFGFCTQKPKWQHVIRIAFLFGGFQAAMPVIGWLLGLSLKDLIAQVDHWIAFGLLGFIGIKMIIGAVRKKKDVASIRFDRWVVLIGLSLATSIDALIVGMGFAFLDVNIVEAIIIIGLTSVIFSLAGILLGKRFGKWLGNKAEIIGGVVLIGIGIKILLEHLLST